MNRSMFAMLCTAGAVYLSGAVINVNADGDGRSWQSNCATCIAGSGCARPASTHPQAVLNCKLCLAAACGSECAESLAGDGHCTPPPVTPPPPAPPLKWWQYLLPWHWFG